LRSCSQSDTSLSLFMGSDDVWPLTLQTAAMRVVFVFRWAPIVRKTFAAIIYVVTGFERLHVLPGAAPAQAGSLVPDKLPLIIFSHGLAGNRLMYSSFCSKLASYGFAVLAIEHADGLASAAKLAGDRCSSFAD
jgi:predicted dienelactone hydrolase